MSIVKKKKMMLALLFMCTASWPTGAAKVFDVLLVTLLTHSSHTHNSHRQQDRDSRYRPRHVRLLWDSAITIIILIMVVITYITVTFKTDINMADIGHPISTTLKVTVRHRSRLLALPAIWLVARLLGPLLQFSLVQRLLERLLQDRTGS